MFNFLLYNFHLQRYILKSLTELLKFCRVSGYFLLWTHGIERKSLEGDRWKEQNALKPTNDDREGLGFCSERKMG